MKAIVLGAGGHARVVLAMLAATGDYDVAGVVDTDTPRPGEIILGVPVLGGINQLTELRNTGVEAAFVAIGDGAARAKAQATLASEGYALPPLVHPSAFISPNVHLGAGTQVCALAFVGPEAVLGDGVVINTQAAVDHESRIGDFATISPAVTIAGRCTIGAGAFLGLGAKVSHGLMIGAGARLGAGAVALADVAPGVLAVGLPARPKEARGKYNS